MNTKSPRIYNYTIHMYALTFWNFKKEINLLCDKINILMVEKRATDGGGEGPGQAGKWV